MKKIIIPFAIASFLFASCSDNTNQVATEMENANESSKEAQEVIENAPVQTKKYQIKSGIITLESITEMGSVKLTEKKVLYFDDYGMKEREDSYEGETLKSSFMSDGKELITLIHGTKTFLKSGKAFRGTAYKVDFNEISQEDKDAGKAKKLNEETILGKTCEVYSYETNGIKSKYAGWNNICLLSEAVMGETKTIVKATKIEEVDVPADKFTIPADYKVQ